MKNTARVIFRIHKTGQEIDLEVPLNISANELVLALNKIYELGIEVTDIKQCYLKAENPIALLKGDKSLQEYGIRNGSVINYTEGE